MFLRLFKVISGPSQRSLQSEDIPCLVVKALRRALADVQAVPEPPAIPLDQAAQGWLHMFEPGCLSAMSSLESEGIP